MHSFHALLDIAADRQGGLDAVEAKMARPKNTAELAAIPDDRWLAAMTRSVFQAGFNWKVVESMWPGFETAFDGFNVGRVAMMDDDWFDALVSDTRIVRHGPKIMAVRDNAVYLDTLRREHGSAARYFADSPPEAFIDLIADLKARGARLGGTSGQYFLRSMGVDSFILARDVVGRLQAEGVIDGPATSKKAQRAIQDAFNTWMAQSDRSLTEISRVLAMSIGPEAGSHRE